MTFKGHVENGAIVFDEPVNLPEGASLQIDIMSAPSSEQEEKGSTLASRLSSVIGSIEGLPEDASINHDHYLYGAPKK
jgi:hypothetical protein